MVAASAEEQHSPVLGAHQAHHAAHTAGHHLRAGSHTATNPNGVLVLYLILFTLIGAQFGLVWWKNKHKRSFDLVSLFGLWLIPGILSVVMHFWLFLTTWVVFTLITLYIFYLCIRSAKLDPSTPRLVFTWFLYSHHACIALGATGYVLVILEIFGAGPLIALIFGQGTSITVLWYGLYFGILGRDTAEVASTTLASSMSFGRKLSVNIHECALCGRELNDMSHVGGDRPPEPTIQLPCNHLFHELCLKGWAMVGKKDTCPTCMEKMDMRKIYEDRPWETRNLQWIGMLDFVRYMIVWNPLILTFLHFFLHILHLDDSDPPPHHPPPAPLTAAPL